MSQTSCFFYGLGMGVAAGVLLAPRSGEKTRQKIAETVQEGQDYVMREGAGLKDSVVEKLNRTKRAAQVTAEGIGVAFEVGKEQLAGNEA
jgi:gas vesicle protein